MTSGRKKGICMFLAAIVMFASVFAGGTSFASAKTKAPSKPKAKIVRTEEANVEISFKSKKVAGKKIKYEWEDLVKQDGMDTSVVYMKKTSKPEFKVRYERTDKNYKVRMRVRTVKKVKGKKVHSKWSKWSNCVTVKAAD